MSKVIQFRVTDEEYQDILNLGTEESANLIVKNEILTRLYSTPDAPADLLAVSKSTLNCSLAIYAIFNQLIDQTLSADKAASIMQAALTQEDELRELMKNDNI
jgi:hypothetical protein